MVSEKRYAQNQSEDKEQNLLRQLDRGIDDVEADRGLLLNEAFQKISELRVNRRDARL